MNPGWGHIADTRFQATRRVEELKKYILETTTGELEDIISYTTDTMNHSVQVTLKGGKSFCMGQIPTQCAWVIVGNYSKGNDKDFIAVIEIAEVLSRLCTYGGLYINSSKEEENNILKAHGFSCTYLNDQGGLFYKATGVLTDDEDYNEDEWYDFEED